jgi:hypothetical protein
MVLIVLLLLNLP